MERNFADFNAESTPREAFSFEEADLALVVWVRAPEAGKERPLAIPLSLIAKLWPELGPTMEWLEEVLRG
jgi:hypothetical protein